MSLILESFKWILISWEINFDFWPKNPWFTKKKGVMLCVLVLILALYLCLIFIIAQTLFFSPYTEKKNLGELNHHSSISQWALEFHNWLKDALLEGRYTFPVLMIKIAKCLVYLIPDVNCIDLITKISARWKMVDMLFNSLGVPY